MIGFVKKNFREENKAVLIVFLISVLCAILAVIIQSRSFIIGYAIATIFLVTRNRNYSALKSIFVFLISTLSITFLLAGYFKTASTAGRILIYKICYEILQENIITGVGWGKFAFVYGEYQTEYFRKGKFTMDEFLLADNTRHAFNDYLQFTIENGIAGFIVLSLLYLLIVISINKSLQNSCTLSSQVVLLVAIVQLIAISVAGMFTHVFEKEVVQNILFLAIVIVLYHAHFQRYKNWCIVASVVGLLSIIYCHHGLYLRNYSYYKKRDLYWKSYQAGYLKDAKVGYSSLYPHLKYDTRFLFEYAHILSALNFKDDAENLMEDVVKRDNANFYNLILADYYVGNGKFKLAEKAYLRAIFRVPNRFSPRRALFNLYVKCHQLKKADSLGRIILRMPVKVQSKQIDFIKEDIAFKLKREK